MKGTLESNCPGQASPGRRCHWILVIPLGPGQTGLGNSRAPVGHSSQVPGLHSLIFSNLEAMVPKAERLFLHNLKKFCQGVEVKTPRGREHQPGQEKLRPRKAKKVAPSFSRSKPKLGLSPGQEPCSGPSPRSAEAFGNNFASPPVAPVPFYAASHSTV